MIETNEQIINMLSETAYAEYASALEMLAACKAAKSSNLAHGYLMHALDEYKHTNIFISLIGKYGSTINHHNKTNRFLPRAVLNKGYVSNKGYLVENLSEKRFIEFIYSNELLAKKSFDGIYALMKDEDERTSIQSIMTDELRHHGSAGAYYRKNYPPSNLPRAFLREKVLNKGRKFYKKNLEFLDRVFRPIFWLLVHLSAPILSAITTRNLPGKSLNLMNSRVDSIL